MIDYRACEFFEKKNLFRKFRVFRKIYWIFRTLDGISYRTDFINIYKYSEQNKNYVISLQVIIGRMIYHICFKNWT